MPLAVDAQFTILMTSMCTFSDSIADYYKDAGTQRVWMVPTAVGWSLDSVDPSDMSDPFDRIGPNGLYTAEYDGTGSDEVRGIMGSHIQIGYMGMMERSFRERHKTPTRAMLHVAGRRMAHGDTVDGVHKAGVENYVTDLFNA
jgi:hypothetical protein